MNSAHSMHDLDEVAVYALGALPEAQARAVAAQVASCPECKTEYEELRVGACCVGWTAELPIASTQAPRPALKAALMREISQNAIPSIAPNAPRRRVWLAYGAAAASIILAIISFASNAALRNENTALRESNASLQTRIAADAQRSLADRRLVAALLSPESIHYAVVGGDVVRYQNRLIVAMYKLPPPPRGKVYQAWTLPKGSTAMAPSVTFVPSAQGWAMVALPERAANVEDVALSVEPEGGSKAPTSKPVFVRKLSSV